MWSTGEVSFETVDDMTDDPVITLRVSTPAGTLVFVAEVAVQGTTLVLGGWGRMSKAPPPARSEWRIGGGSPRR